MNDILFKVDGAIKNYYNKYERRPNTILINEEDFNLLKHSSPPYMAIIETSNYEIYGLKIMPIKYGEIQALEVLL